MTKARLLGLTLIASGAHATRARLIAFAAAAIVVLGAPAPAAAQIFTAFPANCSSLCGAITVGPDGNLLSPEFTASKIGRITPGGTLTEFPTTTANNFPAGITVGPDGNLWFTESSNVDSPNGKIGRITTAGVITEFN